MSIPLALIRSLVIDKVPPVRLYERGITIEDFPEQEGRVLEFVERYFAQYGAVPGTKTIEVELNGFKFPAFPENPTEYWIDQFLDLKRQRKIRAITRELTERVQQNDIDGAEDLIANSRTELLLHGNGGGNVEQITTLPQLSAELLELHDQRARSSEMSGIPFGFPYLDSESESDGAQGGDFVSIIGRPRMGKTWALLHMALSANRHGATVLFASYEMSLIQIGTRLLACAYGIPAVRFRTGRLGSITRKQLSSVLQGQMRLSAKDREYILSETESGRAPSLDDRRDRYQEIRRSRGFRTEIPFHMIKGTFSGTVEELSAVTQALRPDVLYVDGAYLLRTSQHITSRTDRITTTAETLKQLAQYLEIPVFASYQFNREGAKKASLENIYMSDSIAQLSSLALGIGDDPETDEDMESSRIGVKLVTILKAREFAEGAFRIVMDANKSKIYQYEEPE